MNGDEISPRRRDELVQASARVLADVTRLPKWMQAPAWGRSLTPVAAIAVDAVLAELEIIVTGDTE